MSPKRVALIIDDEVAIRRLLSTALGAHGIDVVEAGSGREGIERAIAHRPDFILLDLGLPDTDGSQVLEALRTWYKGPILILSVRDQEDGIVTALDKGADDYLTKPFAVNELLARIRVAERHHLAEKGGAKIEIGPLSLDVPSRLVTKDGQEVRLTATEFDVLKSLAQNLGKVMTHRQLLQQVWGPNAAEHVQYLRVYVGHLRQKLEADPNNPRLLLTEPGIGYRLISR